MNDEEIQLLKQILDELKEANETLRKNQKGRFLIRL
jgi:hypothetical protein